MKDKIRKFAAEKPFVLIGVCVFAGLFIGATLSSL